MYKSILFDQVDTTKYPLKSINMIGGGGYVINTVSRLWENVFVARYFSHAAPDVKMKTCELLAFKYVSAELRTNSQ